MGEPYGLGMAAALQHPPHRMVTGDCLGLTAHAPERGSPLMSALLTGVAGMGFNTPPVPFWEGLEAFPLPQHRTCHSKHAQVGDGYQVAVQVLPGPPTQKECYKMYKAVFKAVGTCEGFLNRARTLLKEKHSPIPTCTWVWHPRSAFAGDCHHRTCLQQTNRGHKGGL